MSNTIDRTELAFIKAKKKKDIADRQYKAIRETVIEEAENGIVFKNITIKSQNRRGAIQPDLLMAYYHLTEKQIDNARKMDYTITYCKVVK